MKTALAKWSGRLSPYRVYTNAFALMLSAAGSGILGIAYWSISAHLTTQKSVGRAAAEIAAITLLASLSQLSFGSVFQRYLPGAADKATSLVVTAYSICLGLSLVIATGYSALGFAKRFFDPSFKWDALFIVTVMIYTIFALQDSVLVSLRVSRWVAVENNLFGVAKIALLLPLATYATGQGIVISWTIPLLATIGVVNWYIFRHRLPNHMRESKISEPLPNLRKIVGLAIPQYTTSILSIFTTSVVTLIVIARKGAVENAYYYLAAQISAAPIILIWSVSKLFIVEASHEPHAIRRLVGQAATAMTAVVVTGMAIGIIFAHQLLSVFGTTYADQGTTLLRLLLLALPGAAVAALYVAFAWIDGRVWYLMIREGVTMLVFLAIVLAFIGSHGINAVGYAAVATSGVEFLLFLPILIRRIRAIPPTIVEPTAP